VWNSSNDHNCAFYFHQIPELLEVTGSVGFQECPWQADGCEPAGYTMIKVNPDIDLGPTGQLAVAARWPGSLRFDIPAVSGRDSRPDKAGPGDLPWNRGPWIRDSFADLPAELQPYQVFPSTLSYALSHSTT
jgi:hypothetical protein